MNSIHWQSKVRGKELEMKLQVTRYLDQDKHLYFICEQVAHLPSDIQKGLAVKPGCTVFLHAQFWIINYCQLCGSAVAEVWSNSHICLFLAAFSFDQQMAANIDRIWVLIYTLRVDVIFDAYSFTCVNKNNECHLHLPHSLLLTLRRKKVNPFYTWFILLKGLSWKSTWNSGAKVLIYSLVIQGYKV